MKFWVNLYFDMGTTMSTVHSLRRMGNGQTVWPHNSGSREMLQFSSGSPNSHIYEGWITVCNFLLRTVYSLKLLTYRNRLRSLANRLPSAGLDKNAEVLGCKGSWYCLAPDLLMCECYSVPRTKVWRVYQSLWHFSTQILVLVRLTIHRKYLWSILLLQCEYMSQDQVPFIGAVWKDTMIYLDVFSLWVSCFVQMLLTNTCSILLLKD